LSTVLRLARVGRKNVARYRIVAADSRMPRDGRFLEVLGTYNPQSTPKQFTIEADRMAYWIKQGATPSETIGNILKQDRFYEKMEALGKGLTAETMNIARLPERKRKAKTHKEKKAS